MAYEHREGQGSLFKNEKQNDRQPDYKGTILVGGVTYEIAAWERTSQKGTGYLSLQASLPRERSNSEAPARYSQPLQPQPRNIPAPTYEDIPPMAENPDEDLPF